MQLFCAASMLDTDSQCALSASYFARPESTGLSPPPPPPHAQSSIAAARAGHGVTIADRRRGTAAVLISRSCSDDAVTRGFAPNLLPPHAVCEAGENARSSRRTESFVHLLIHPD